MLNILVSFFFLYFFHPVSKLSAIKLFNLLLKYSCFNVRFSNHFYLLTTSRFSNYPASPSSCFVLCLTRRLGARESHQVKLRRQRGLSVARPREELQNHPVGCWVTPSRVCVSAPSPVQPGYMITIYSIHQGEVIIKLSSFCFNRLLNFSHVKNCSPFAILIDFSHFLYSITKSILSS